VHVLVERRLHLQSLASPDPAASLASAISGVPGHLQRHWNRPGALDPQGPRSFCPVNNARSRRVMTWGDVQQYVQVLWVDPTTGLERLALTRAPVAFQGPSVWIGLNEFPSTTGNACYSRQPRRNLRCTRNWLFFLVRPKKRHGSWALFTHLSSSPTSRRRGRREGLCHEMRFG
jgi:hypothetical protein